MGGYDIRLDDGRDTVEGWIGIQGTHYSVQMKGIPSESLYISDSAVVREMPGEECNRLWQAGSVSSTGMSLGKEHDGWTLTSNGPVATNLKVECRRQPQAELAFELRAAYLKECLSRHYLWNLVCAFEFVGLLHAEDWREHLPALLYAIGFKDYGEAPAW